MTLNAQFYVKGGLLINQQNKQIKDLNLYKDKASYILGIGQELKILRILRLDAGVRFMNFHTEDVTANVEENIMSLGLPIQAKIRPFTLIDVGAGIMPIIRLNDDNSVFSKKAEVGGLFSLGINLNKLLALEATYNFGLAADGISFFDLNGNLIDEVQDRFQFYTLGAKIRI